jgi:hypothetical protein
MNVDAEPEASPLTITLGTGTIKLKNFKKKLTNFT